MSETEIFDRDDHPGAPRILFIGSAQSSHTHAWMQLLDGTGLNARLFSPIGDDQLPPADFAPRCYFTIPGLRLNTANRRNLLAAPADAAEDALAGAKPERLRQVLAVAEQRGMAREQLRDYRLTRGQRARGMLRQLRRLLLPLPVPPGLLAGQPLPWLPPMPLAVDLMPHGPTTAEAALLEVIKHWRPDIVHTFGFFDAGRWFHDIHRRHGLAGKLRWVIQFRGGSDLSIRRHIPARRNAIIAAAQDADLVVNDNLTERDYLRAWGIPPERFATLTPVPGSGGVEVPASLEALTPTSARDVILWPKAYSIQTAQGLPVLEALRLAWDRLPPCRIVMLWAMQPDFLEWVEALPPPLRAACEVHDRVSRSEVFTLLRQARVLLAPSLADGRPNVLFEAGVSGAVPILSPIPTITEFVTHEHALFARNLYPEEIAEALVRAMTDDALVDRLAAANLELVRRVADRTAIAPQVQAFYRGLAAAG